MLKNQRVGHMQKDTKSKLQEVLMGIWYLNLNNKINDVALD